MSIPKKIHIAWNNKDVLTSDHPLIQNGLFNLKTLNPEWSLEISNDLEIDNYLKNHLCDEDYGILKDLKIVPKTDIWRLLKIYYEGGLYVDIDRLCNISLDSFLNDKIDWVLPICDYRDFSHDFMMSAPGNPAFKNIITLYFQRRYQGFNNTYFLGAQTYMHGITSTFLNKIIDVNPGKNIFSEIIKVLSELDYVKLFIETLPNHSII